MDVREKALEAALRLGGHKIDTAASLIREAEKIESWLRHGNRIPGVTLGESGQIFPGGTTPPAKEAMTQ